MMSALWRVGDVRSGWEGVGWGPRVNECAVGRPGSAVASQNNSWVESSNQEFHAQLFCPRSGLPKSEYRAECVAEPPVATQCHVCTLCVYTYVIILPRNISNMKIQYELE